MSGWEPSVRSSLIVLEEPPAGQISYERGRCMWCGERIEIVEGAHHARKLRTYHYGDKWEVGDAPDCAGAMRGSRCWSARDALSWQARREHEGKFICADCGTICGLPGEHFVAWEADHEVPLIDGGAHELANFRVRCVECHDMKTRREASERAIRAPTQLHEGQIEIGEVA